MTWRVEHLGGSVVEHLPLHQVMIPGSWDRVLHRAPCGKPTSPSAYASASLCVSLMNKYVKPFKKKMTRGNGVNKTSLYSDSFWEVEEDCIFCTNLNCRCLQKGGHTGILIVWVTLLPHSLVTVVISRWNVGQDPWNISQLRECFPSTKSYQCT